MTEREALLCAYVDGELDPDAVREVERLIGGDARLARMIDQYRQMGGLLRAACGEQFYASAPLSLRASTAASPQRRRVLVAGAAAACAAALAGFGLGNVWHQRNEDDLLGEIAEYHSVYSQETAHLVEVPASRAAELTGWLGEKVGRAIPVPALEAQGLRFAGGRMLVIGGEPVAQLVYVREHGLPIGVCIARLAGKPQGLELAKRDGLRLATWRDRDHVYVVVGDIGKAALSEIAGKVARDLAV